MSAPIVVVCGGRAYADAARVKAILDANVTMYDIVAHGDANGADALVDDWAMARGLPVLRAPANWKFHGKAAGHWRNATLAALNPRLVIAFPGGRGTADMVQKSRNKGFAVIEVEP